MAVLRLILIAFLVVSASLSSAMELSHAMTSDAVHSAVDHDTADMPECCDEGVERGHNCHVLQAVPDASLVSTTSNGFAKAALFFDDLLLAGIEPNKLLDPPRLV